MCSDVEDKSSSGAHGTRINDAFALMAHAFKKDNIYRTLYSYCSWLNRVVSGFLKRMLGVGIPLVYGLFGTLMPFPGRITIVVGRPIEVGKANPVPEAFEIDEFHAKYCEALVALYEEHKAEAGYAHMQLTIR